MRDKKLIVGNWKMNLNMQESSLFLDSLSKKIKVHRNVEVVVAPTMLVLQSLSLQINRRQIKLASQNLFWRDSGPFTGEVSAHQLDGIVDYAIIGHSERRHMFRETDKDVRAKVQAAIRNKITPILCVGETASERADGEASDVLHDQLVGGLSNVTSDEIGQVVVAYEPVWAIGTGVNALPKDVIAAERTIRSQIRHLYGEEASRAVRVLYGGSVSKDSAADYLAIKGIDGLLIGGASLRADDFAAIVEKAFDIASDEAQKNKVGK